MDLIEAKKQPTVVSLPHPLRADAKEVSVAAFLPNETLGAYIERVGLRIAKGPVHVWHNGYRVPEALWTRLIPRNGDSIVIRAKMEGGGGRKVLRTVAMVALMLAAPYIAGYAMTGAWAAATGLMGGLVTAGIMIGGSLLINALLPPITPTLGKLGTGQKYESSPTYSIQGGRNRMRQWEPMTLIFGRHKVVPDLGAQYYTERVGDNQFLNQVFHFGLQGLDVELSDFRIGATPLNDYQDVQLEVSDIDGSLAMFPGNVDTLQGFMLESGVVNSRTTPPDVTQITVELAARLFTIADTGELRERSVDVRIQYRKIGEEEWKEAGWIDAVYATHYWSAQKPDGSQMRYGSTNPSDHRDGDSYFINVRWRWVPHPHTLGQPWRGRAPDPFISAASPGIRMRGSRQDPVYRSVTIEVPKGQYEIRLWKVTGDVNNSRNSNETAVSQILCFQPDDANYAGQARVALRIKATSQLNGAVDELSAIAQGLIPVWTGAEYEQQATSNPAWWFRWFAKGKYDAETGNRIYGAGLTDAQIDDESIKAWAAWCDTKNLTFNYVLDRKMSTAEVLQMIARAGRASPTWQSGKLGVVWDAADLPHVAMFGPFNIKAGTFKVDYINEGNVDEIIVNFINEQTWQMDEVRAKVPGATTTNNPIQLDFDGCTKAEMAGREANLIAASQVWHRRRISWETDIEGWVANRGDVVQFSHDLTVWGYSGRLVARDGSIVTLDKHVPTDGSGTMMLRGPEGQMRIVSVVSEAGEVDSVSIISELDDFPLPGDEGYEEIVPMDWAWFFDPLATPGRRFKITHVEPVGSEGVKFEAIDDDPGYYASEYDPYIYVPPRDGALLGGVVMDISPTESIADMAARTFAVQFDWVLSAASQVDVIVSVNGAPRPAVRTEERSISVIAMRGDEVRVSVTPVRLAGKGQPKEFTHTVEGIIPTPIRPESASLEVVGAQLRLSWPRSPDVWVTGYEVRDTDASWGEPGYLFRGDALSCLVAPGEPNAATAWYVRAINAAGLYSDDSASASYVVSLPDDPTNVTATFEDTSLTTATVTLDWDAVEPVFGLDYYRVSYGSVVKLAKSTTITLPADWIGSREFTIQTVDMLGNASPGLVTNIEKLAPLPPTSVRAQVIDNNVLLYWTLPQRTTLPIDHVLVKEGETWATGREVGTKKGSFTSLSELTPGQKRYWLATVDTDGWESDPVSIVAHVSEPPDFIFRGEIQSELDGTLTNGVRRPEGVLLPVNTTETWQQHFGDRSWGSPQDQVDDGYPVYIQPTPTPGIYVEEFDFGTVVPSSRVDVAVVGVVVAGNPTIEQTIQTSQDGVTWSSPTNGTSVFATNFRYVRYTLRVIQVDDRALYRLNSIVVTLSTKMKNDGGNTDCLASDPNGTIANFNMTFIDVSSITLTPAGTSPKTAVYDFKDAVLSGTYSIVSGVATVNVNGHGLLPGQDVMLLYANREPQRATVQTATANSFTALVDGPNKSGNLQIYSQSMRIYLFDANGNRASGSVSWAIKGN